MEPATRPPLKVSYLSDEELTFALEAGHCVLVGAQAGH